MIAFIDVILTNNAIELRQAFFIIKFTGQFFPFMQKRHVLIRQTFLHQGMDHQINQLKFLPAILLGIRKLIEKTERLLIKAESLFIRIILDCLFTGQPQIVTGFLKIFAFRIVIRQHLVKLFQPFNINIFNRFADLLVNLLSPC